MLIYPHIHGHTPTHTAHACAPTHADACTHKYRHTHTHTIFYPLWCLLFTWCLNISQNTCYLIWDPPALKQTSIFVNKAARS